MEDLMSLFKKTKNVLTNSIIYKRQTRQVLNLSGFVLGKKNPVLILFKINCSIFIMF